MSVAAGCQVCDVIILISTGVSVPIYSFLSFHHFGFSIVPKPRLILRIRLSWLPFGTDLPIKELLVGILPAVFVVRIRCNVLPLEKSITCEEPPPLLTAILHFTLKF